MAKKSQHDAQLFPPTLLLVGSIGGRQVLVTGYDGSMPKSKPASADRGDAGPWKLWKGL